MPPMWCLAAHRNACCSACPFPPPWSHSVHRRREPVQGPARSIAQGGRRAGNPWGDTVMLPAGTLARHARPTGVSLDFMRGLGGALGLIVRGAPTMRPRDLAPTTEARRATHGDSLTADLPVAGCPRRRLRPARSAKSHFSKIKNIFY